MIKRQKIKRKGRLGGADDKKIKVNDEKKREARQAQETADGAENKKKKR